MNQVQLGVWDQCYQRGVHVCVRPESSLIERANVELCHFAESTEMLHFVLNPVSLSHDSEEGLYIWQNTTCYPHNILHIPSADSLWGKITMYKVRIMLVESSLFLCPSNSMFYVNIVLF